MLSLDDYYALSNKSDPGISGVARVVRDTECNPTVLKYDFGRGVARVVRDDEVEGSNPFTPTIN